MSSSVRFDRRKSVPPDQDRHVRPFESSTRRRPTARSPPVQRASRPGWPARLRSGTGQPACAERVHIPGRPVSVSVCLPPGCRPKRLVRTSRLQLASLEAVSSCVLSSSSLGPVPHALFQQAQHRCVLGRTTAKTGLATGLGRIGGGIAALCRTCHFLLGAGHHGATGRRSGFCGTPSHTHREPRAPLFLYGAVPRRPAMPSSSDTASAFCRNRSTDR